MSARKSPLADRPSIFRRTDAGVPELADQQNSGTSEQPTSQAARVKRTFYLPPEDVLLLSELQVDDQRRTGRKPELSALVSEAIRLLREQRLAAS